MSIDKMRRDVLIISPYFPPSTVAGVHRARHIAKHLPAFGWTPVVICVDEVFHEQRLDPDLADLVPKSVEIMKTRAINSSISRPFGIGDISLRAWWFLRKAVYGALERRPVGAVFITGSPFYPMLLAPTIKERFGIPVVLDFQDPWVSAWGETQPWNSKAGLSHRLAKILEPRALLGADFVTSVSETQNAEMVARYPWLDPGRMASLPIGGDPDDFSNFQTSIRKDAVSDLDPKFFNLCYVGTFMPRSVELVRLLFRSFKRLIISDPALASKLRMNFLGTSNQSNDFKNFRVSKLAEEEGVLEYVRETPQRLPYLRALKCLRDADAIMLIGSDEPHYTASKIYPALMSGRPFLSLFHEASSAHDILVSTGGGISLKFSNADELAALDIQMTDAIKRLTTAGASLPPANPQAYELYQAHAIAKEFSKIFDLLRK